MSGFFFAAFRQCPDPVCWVPGRHWKEGDLHRLHSQGKQVVSDASRRGSAVKTGGPRIPNPIGPSWRDETNRCVRPGKGGPDRAVDAEAMGPEIAKQQESLHPGFEGHLLSQDSRKEPWQNGDRSAFSWLTNSVRMPVASQFPTGRRNSSCRPQPRFGKARPRGQGKINIDFFSLAMRRHMHV